jgi:hypothetical protein
MIPDLSMQTKGPKMQNLIQCFLFALGNQQLQKEDSNGEKIQMAKYGDSRHFLIELRAQKTSEQLFVTFSTTD